MKELIKSGKRAIVFIDRDVKNSKYPWLLDGGFFRPWPMEYHFTKQEDLMKSIVGPDDVFRKGFDYKINDTDPKNKVLNVPYAVTIGFAGKPEIANIINSKRYMEPRMHQIMKLANHIVNGISVDFYEIPNMDVFDVINHINGVGKYKNKPLWQPAKTSTK